jgi:hypothetical protein
MQSKGKLIRSLAEEKLKTMRAATLTLSLAFSWGSSETESLENSEGGTSPPPKNVERNILEYIDRKKKDTFFTTNLL